MGKASPGRRSLWRLRLGGEGCRIQALGCEGVRLTFHANDLSPGVDPSAVHLIQ